MRCVIPIRLVTDPAWGPDHVPSNQLVPQASPTTSEARGTTEIRHTTEGGASDMSMELDDFGESRLLLVT